MEIWELPTEIVNFIWQSGKNYYFSTKSHNLSLFLIIILSKARNFLATAVNRPLFKLFKEKSELILIKISSK
jgi:hypothetical protein